MATSRLDHLPASVAAEATDTPPASVTTTPTLLTLPEVAKRLAVSARTVRRLIDGRALAHVRVGKTVRVSEADLAEFAALNRHPTRSKTANQL